MDSAFNYRPDPSRQAREESPFWDSILGRNPDHYDLSRQVEQEQQIYRENRLSQHITPHLLDQAASLIKITGFH